MILDTRLASLVNVKYAAAETFRYVTNLARLIPSVNRVLNKTRRLLAAVAKSVTRYTSAIWTGMVRVMDKTERRSYQHRERSSPK